MEFDQAARHAGGVQVTMKPKTGLGEDLIEKSLKADVKRQGATLSITK